MTAPTTPQPFVFDKDYDNLTQVAHLWDAYNARYRELEQAGTFPYNDLFKGRIKGLVAEDGEEDSAIFLLQVTRRVREYQEKVQALHDAGYQEPTVNPEGDRMTKYTSVAIVGYQYKHYGDVQIIESARLYSQSGTVVAVLPKGARTHGHSVRDRAYVLVKK